MNQRTNIILPIILAALLPLINIITNPESVRFEIGSREFLARWGQLFVILLAIWHMLEKGYTWKLQRNWIGMGIAGFLWGLIIYLSSFSYINDLVVPGNWQVSIRLVVASCIFLVIQMTIRANSRIAALMLDKQQLQTENYKVELESLRSKVNPHFLFNSLTTLRNMIRNGHGNPDNFIMNLSEFYRQSLNHNDTSVITLGEEMKTLKAYFSLMKSRIEEGVNLEINVNQELYLYKIPTFALQLVAENCLKHNIASSSKPLTISIRTKEDVYLEIRNNIQPKLTLIKKSGYGIDNIRRRYELLGISNGIIINQTPEQFEVKLKLI